MSNDAAVIARLVKLVSGECRVCGCHGDSCSLPEGDHCVWTDRLRTLCSNPPCQTAAGKGKRKRRWAARRRDSKRKGRAA